MAPQPPVTGHRSAPRLPSGLLVALFGLAIAGAAWLDVLSRQQADRGAELERVHRENGGMARAVEEHVRRVLVTADNALRFLMQDYAKHGRVTEAMVDFVARAKHDSILNQIALADSRGDLLLSAVPLTGPINIADREHFQVHAARGDVGLFVGKPVITRIAGTWSFFLTRRLNRPDGGFAGIVSVGLDPAYFSSYFAEPELGQDRAILLVGRDGIVRARRFQQQFEIGQDLGASPLFEHLRRAPAGHYDVAGVIDRQQRFASYRALPDYPLVVVVSDLTAHVLAPFERRASRYRATALVFTFFVAGFCLLLIRLERRTRRQNAHLTAELAERRKAEEALRESQDLFSAFLDHIPAVVFVQNLQGEVLYSNQAYKSLPGREAVGRNTRELLAVDRAGAPGAPPALRGRSVTLDERIVGDDGGARTFETRMFVVERAGKEPLLGCIAVDSTARRQAEEERFNFERRMQQTQKLESLGVLAGGIAHDFNNLLLVILGNADLALAKSTPESPVREYIRNIDTAAQRAADLANQMLAYSGKGRFLVEPIDLSLLVKEMGHLLASVIARRSSMHYRLAAGLPPVHADATQVRQVVMNLITNASDALGERGGAIMVATGVVEVGAAGHPAEACGPPLQKGTYAFIEVADTGCGMDQSTLARIFDPFYTTKHAGRGLGLASVLGIVRGHGGEIRVASDPGRGTTFTVLLPVVRDGGPVLPAAGGKPAPEHPADREERLVLLVEDEEHVHQTTRALLEESGYSVLSALDGVEGVEIFRERHPHLCAVVLDMNMPRMDGAEAFRLMRDIAPGVPVILTSGLDGQDAVSQFTGAGLADFIQKPYRMEALVRKIAAAIESRASTA